jgi:salicylate hydroxylase
MPESRGTDSDDVMIAGGGIGGVSAALCLAKQGFNVQVFEQTGELAEVGAGIQLSPNCTRVLHHLELKEALAPFVFLPEAVEMRSWRTGKVLSSNPLGQNLLELYGLPYYHIHRADLLSVLVRKAEQDPRITLHAGVGINEFEQNESSVVVEVNGRRLVGRLLIGADGIHSTVRERLFGAEAPRFTGNVAWRALVETARLPKGLIRPMATAWWGPHKHFVHYFVRGGELVNCVCVVEKKGWEVESWTERGDRSELQADFAGWHQTVESLIDNMDPDNCFKWALYDRLPMARWSFGRVTLLGDACHPTLPFMAQGAAMAIEDGAVLAGVLAQEGEVSRQLQRYESLRRARTAKIQSGSRRNAKLFHMSGVPAWFRDQAVAKAPGNVMRWLFEYDALAAGNSTTPMTDIKSDRH